MQLEQGQVAVVTGAGSGIGLALAEAFADRGLAVVLADVEEVALDQAVARFAARGAEALGVPTDVGSAHDVDALAKATLRVFGRVDIVVNNAGVVGPWGSMWELDLHDWEWVLRVNLWGVIHGIRSFVPHLVLQGRGHVVNIASMSGLRPRPGNAPYAVTKHAVVGITEGLRAELDRLGSSVGTTVVCPGTVETRILKAERNRPRALVGAGSDEAAFAWWTGVERVDYDDAQQPDDVALSVLEAVEKDRLYLLPTPGTVPEAVARIERLLSGIDPRAR